MNEKDFDRILKADNSLRDAIRHREEKRPPMPEGLNDRLMQRIEKEVPARPAKTRRLIWPWIAAACVAAIMVVLLMPPRMSREGMTTEAPRAEVVKSARPEGTLSQSEATERKVQKVQEVHDVQGVQKANLNKNLSPVNSKLSTDSQLSTVTSQLTTVPDSEETKEVLPLPQAQPKPEPRMLTERDIPITRPENYHYTPEEIALMKKQANEAYLKWMELELEIAKHNLEQMAQQ